MMRASMEEAQAIQRVVTMAWQNISTVEDKRVWESVCESLRACMDQDSEVDDVVHMPDTSRVLVDRLDDTQVSGIVSADLAMHAAIHYYDVTLKIGHSFPPRAETVMRTAREFMAFYAEQVTQPDTRANSVPLEAPERPVEPRPVHPPRGR